jgi:hypothetical protein
MIGLCLRFSIIALAFAAPALAAPEDEALQAFNSLYGDEVKRVLSTPDTADDAALAGKLLETAKTVAGQPALMAILCEKAAELGKSSPAGRATAAQAMELLATHRKIAALKARLQSAPTDAAVRTELVTALVVDLNDPAAAAKFVDATLDAALQKFVPAAARGIDQTPELACPQLGDWYRGLADKAPAPARPPMLARARAYYDRFLGLHAAEDLARAQVTLALKKLDEAAAPAEAARAETPKPDTTARPAGTAKAGPTGKAATPAASAAAAGETLAANQWHDLMKYIDTNKDPVFGNMPIGWRREQGAIACSNSGYSSESKISVPVMPQGSYDLQVKFAISGSTYGHVGIFLPAGAGATVLRLDCSGQSGLNYVNGRNASYNGTGTPTMLTVRRVYTVEVRVTLTGDQASIVATLDGKPLVQWSGSQTALSPAESMDMRCMGLHTYYTSSTFGSLRMRPAQEARIYKSDGKGPMLPRSMMSTRSGPASTGPGGDPSGNTPGGASGRTP